MAAIICYHGTTEKASQSISWMGFLPDSWFALHIEDAIAFGGLYVFVVIFESEKIPGGAWQFHVLNAVPITQIIKLEKR